MAFEKSRVIDLWHQRIGHPEKQRLSLTVNKELVSGINVSKMLSFVKGVSKEKYSVSLFSKWEKLDQLRNCNWHTVMRVVPCPQDPFGVFRHLY